MRIEEVKVYKFEELEKSIQEKVIEKYYENEDYDYFSDDLKESLYNNEKNIFDGKVKLWYSLSYCQGDGLNIEGDLDIEKILNMLSTELRERFAGKIYRLFTKSNNSRYSYHSRLDIQYELDLTDKDDYDKMHEIFEEEILPIIWNLYNDLCIELQKEGYSTLEYRMSTKEFQDLCESNNYEFYEDGEMF